ncbi:BatD family protein [Spongiibacter marinus]|uniref:BatD family protein n=1 Tax=Spongiibacter marinus TaxID=354246 RepID=UPI0003FE162A|nr:BatD family protein [Spongiibacter marinus]
MPRIKYLMTLWLSVFALCCSGLAQAETTVRATVDRNQVALEETLNLTLSADSILFSGEPDVSELSNDFHILNRQQSSRTNIVNGNISSSRQWDYTLAPKREGDLTIPAITMGNKQTKAISIHVTPPNSTRRQNTDNRQVWLEADITPRRGYVQQILEYSVKLYSSVNFLDATLDPLDVDNALVESLGESRYRQRIDGRSFQVIERRYAVFPQRSGTLEIPALTLQARVESYRPSLLDPGRLLIRRSPPMEIDIQSPPIDFDGALWLPAGNVEIFEEWSSDPEQLQVGESITRRVDIRAEGLMAAQLPALPRYDLAGAKLYPDQPILQNNKDEQILVGLRSESTAIIANEAGRYTLPEIKLAWWNTRTNRAELAVLPARELIVSPAPGAPGDEAAEAATLQPEPSAAPLSNATNTTAETALTPYRIIIALLICTNLLCLWALLRRRNDTAGTPQRDAEQKNDQQEKAAYQRLKKACKQRDASAARAALQDWASHQQDGYRNLAELAAHEPAFATHVDNINAELYRAAEPCVDYAALLQTAATYRKQQAESPAKPALAPLYKSL